MPILNTPTLSAPPPDGLSKFKPGIQTAILLVKGYKFTTSSSGKQHTYYGFYSNIQTNFLTQKLKGPKETFYFFDTRINGNGGAIVFYFLDKNQELPTVKTIKLNNLIFTNITLSTKNQSHSLSNSVFSSPVMVDLVTGKVKNITESFNVNSYVWQVNTDPSLYTSYNNFARTGSVYSLELTFEFS